MSFSPSLAVNYVTLVVGEVLLLILTVCALAATFPRVRKHYAIFRFQTSIELRL